MQVEVPIDAGKGDGSLTTTMIPLLLPHKILQYLMAAGVKVDMSLVHKYWAHLQDMGVSWAKRVNDNSLIP